MFQEHLCRLEPPQPAAVPQVDSQPQHDQAVDRSQAEASDPQAGSRQGGQYDNRYPRYPGPEIGLAPGEREGRKYRPHGRERVERNVAPETEETAETLGGHIFDAQREVDLRVSDAFQRQRPPTFSGGSCEAAENWVEAMGKIFDFLNCDDRHRVMFAVYKLEGDAFHWWKDQKRILESKGEVITWGKFREAFFVKYFPASLRISKAQEFANLRQGRMTVSEYETKFNALCRFSTEPLDDLTKLRKFEDGLAEGIRGRVILCQSKSYGASVENALFVERDTLELDRRYLKRERSPTKDKAGKKFSGQSSSGQAEGETSTKKAGFLKRKKNTR